MPGLGDVLKIPPKRDFGTVFTKFALAILLGEQKRGIQIIKKVINYKYASFQIAH